MAKSGGLRVGITYKWAESYLYALTNGDYRIAGEHLNALAKFLKIDIPRPPLNDAIYPSDALLWQKYCLQNEAVVLAGIDRNLLKYGKNANPFQLVRKGEEFEDDLSGEEGEE